MKQIPLTALVLVALLLALVTAALYQDEESGAAPRSRPHLDHEPFDVAEQGNSAPANVQAGGAGARVEQSWPLSAGPGGHGRRLLVQAVDEAGRPVADAKVIITGEPPAFTHPTPTWWLREEVDPSAILSTGKTDALGRWAALLPRVVGDVAVAAIRQAEAGFVLVDWDDEECVVELKGRSRTNINVISATSQPAAGATVVCEFFRRSGRSVTVTLGRTNPAGMLSFDAWGDLMRHWNGDLSASTTIRVGGLASSSSASFLWPNIPASVELLMEPTGSMTIRIIDEFGHEGLKFARVVVQGEAKDSYRFAVMRTDAFGNAMIPHVALGQKWLVRLMGGLGETETEMYYFEGPSINDLNPLHIIRLPAKSRIKVTLSTARGPYSGAEVICRLSPWDVDIASESDSNGQVLVALPRSYDGQLTGILVQGQDGACGEWSGQLSISASDSREYEIGPIMMAYRKQGRPPEQGAGNQVTLALRLRGTLGRFANLVSATLVEDGSMVEQQADSCNVAGGDLELRWLNVASGSCSVSIYLAGLPRPIAEYRVQSHDDGRHEPNRMDLALPAGARIVSLDIDESQVSNRGRAVALVAPSSQGDGLTREEAGHSWPSLIIEHEGMLQFAIVRPVDVLIECEGCQDATIRGVIAGGSIALAPRMRCYVRIDAPGPIWRLRLERSSKVLGFRQGWWSADNDGQGVFAVDLPGPGNYDAYTYEEPQNNMVLMRAGAFRVFIEKEGGVSDAVEAK